MSEDKVPSDFDGSKNGPSPVENEETNPERRVIRRRILGKMKPIFKRDKQNENKKEINEVLTNLYGEKGSHADIQEITIQENSWFARIFSFLGFALVFAAVIWTGLFFFPQTDKENSQVELSIDGPKDLSLGATSTYVIHYENKSGVGLNNVVLNAYYPEGFVFLKSNPQPENAARNEWKISTLDAYEKGNITVSGLTYGSLNEEKSWRVFLNYSPENFNSELQKATTLTTVISNSPAKLVISGPDKASVGPDVSFTFSAQTSADLKGNLAIQPELPDNFVITSSSPLLDKKTGMWNLGKQATSSKNFTVTGKFISVGDEPSPVKGKVILQYSTSEDFEIAKAQITTELLKSEVALSLAINGAVNDFDSKPGDILNVSLRIRNDSAKEITEVVPKITFSAPSVKKVSILKFSDLVDKNENTLVGEQIDDSTRRGILNWNKSQLNALSSIKPNSEVSIDIQLPIKNASEFDLSSIKNALIAVNAELKFKDANKITQTIGSKPINITLNSDLTFSTDDTIDNQGTDAEKHTVSWVVKNNFHNLKDVKIVASTFGNVKFTLLNKAAGDLTFDQEENKITWTIPEMVEEANVLNCSFELMLTGKNPTQSLLLSKAHLTATDVVTGKEIDLAGEEISLIAQ
jgi:hypothetical protein